VVVDQPARRRRRRTRRTPEEARALLLSAAESLIAEHGPDGVTLRDVAEAVGVTPGLVTHYFGTYAELVRAVIQRQDALTRDRIRRELEAGERVPDADTLIRILFEALSDPRRIRLFAWAQLRGELRASSTRGLRDLVDALEASFHRTLPAAEVPLRSRIEMVVLLALAATHGYAVGKHAWLPGLGIGPARTEHDEAFRSALTTVLRRYMAAGA
jgi:AcrR family transcriptional regulator